MKTGIIQVEIIKGLTVVLVLGSPILATAHNTNLTHNLQTEKALELIVASDSNDKNYEELYEILLDPLTEDPVLTTNGGQIGRNIYRFWGYNPRYVNMRAGDEEDNGDHFGPSSYFRCHRVDDKAGNVVWLSQDYNCFNEYYEQDYDQTVLGGAIQEDTPVNRVFSHFDHAYTGNGLGGDGTFVGGLAPFGGSTEPSRVTARRFFYDSINIFGYKEFILNEYIDLYNANGNVWLGLRFAKNIGYWLMGHSLHHVEDMNSIGHVHDDSHQTFTSETDKYEAVYLPFNIQFYNRDESIQPATDWFKIDPVNFPPIDVTSLTDIWAPTISEPTELDTLDPDTLESDSLSRTTYNISTFRGTLKVPKEYISRYESVEHGLFCGSGELAEMFETVSSNGVVEECGLDFATSTRGRGRNFRRTTLFSIPNIGNYYGGFRTKQESDWWPLSFNGGPNPSAGEDYFYLEVLLHGSPKEFEDKFETSQLANPVQNRLVKPNKLRRHIEKPVSSSNPLEDNISSMPLTEKFADYLMPLGTQYFAGFAKHWFDIANTPPYLKAVQVMQKYDVLKKEESGEEVDWIKKYKSEWGIRWRNETTVLSTHGISKGTATLVDETLHIDEEIDFLYVKERRNIKIGSNILISDQEAITFCLTFNESVRTPGSANSGFKIGLVFDDIDPSTIIETPLKTIPFDLSTANIGHVVSGSGGYVWNPNGEVEPVPIGKNTTPPKDRLRCQRIVEVDSSLEADYDEKDKSDLKSFNTTEETWAVEIPKEFLPAALIKSRREERSPPWITAHLVVEAEDKNNHWYDVNVNGSTPPMGALGRLDALPNTPARRYVQNPDTETYAWHSKSSFASSYYFPGTTSSIQGVFSYDFQFADINHQILFAYRDEAADAKRGSDGKVQDVSGLVQDDKEKPPEN